MKHELKIEPAYYQAVSDRRKTFEIRYNDRGFQAGDIVVLKECSKNGIPKILMGVLNIPVTNSRS